MPRTNRLMIGARVMATDGLCGLVKSLLVDASGPRVTHIVVEPEHRIGLGRFVRVGLVSGVREVDAGNEIDVQFDLAEFETLPMAETSEIVPDVSASYVYVQGPPIMTREVHPVVPPGETPLERGFPVVVAGHEVGKVAGFDTEVAAHDVVNVLVDEGHFPWGHRTVVVPVGCVGEISSSVDLTITHDEFAAL
ncbi:MAG TPA: hypothetical protein VFN61_14910 [Acidimicrobiales bacterium]|nr:hypothetical protein [Acidimicrobiales bacterium]